MSALAPGRLAERVAFVSGAGRNIGRAIALRVADEGAAVVVADRDEQAAQETVALLHARGSRAVAAVGDLTDVVEIDDLFAEAEEALGVVDILVNNAYARLGATNWGPFLQVEPEDWQEFVDRNMMLLFGCTQRFARRLANERRPGAVVNISSNGSDRAHRNSIPYDSVKGAMDSFTRAVAVDLAPWGIRVNAIRPGAIDVDNMPTGDPHRDTLRIAQIPLGRGGTPEDVAAGVAYLASDDSAYVTGQVYNIDGGLLAQGRAPQLDGEVATPTTLGEVRPTLRKPSPR